MSKIVVLGLDNLSKGQFDAIVPAIAWNLNGHPNVSGGGSTQVSISDDVAAERWMDFGRMVIVSPADLPAYVGMIDTPWSATSPVQVTIYDPEYLLNLRVSESSPLKLSGNVENILSQIVDIANSQEDLFLRMGVVQDIDPTYREETLDGRTLWEQVKALLLRSGTEMKFRPEQGADGRWYVYLDIARSMGIDTEFLLSDGDQGNMKIRSAVVRNEIVNRMIGISSQSSVDSRLKTDPLESASSIALYRMRNRFVQFRDVTDISTLQRNTQNSLNASSMPYLEMAVDVLNIDHAFLNLRLGNRVIAHASKIILNGGVRGWKGSARITKMAFSESTKSVTMTLIGDL